MIKILRQRLLHFGSFSNHVIDYDGETTLLGGMNGTGKSQLIEALRYALGNADFQRPESCSPYYIKKGVNVYSAATVTLSNVDDKGQASAFRRIQIKDPVVTVGVVYVPKPDDKIPRYHIMSGDVGMEDFVKQAIQKGISRAAFRAKLRTCQLTEAVIRHLFVQQGKAGELALKKPRELYQVVLAQSGHTETKEQYEAAIQETAKTGRQLDQRERDLKNTRLDLRAAGVEVEALETYERHQRELEQFQQEDRVRVMWRIREERDRLQERCEKAKELLKDLPERIDGLAKEIADEEDEISSLERDRDNWEVNRHAAERIKEEARDKHQAAEKEVEVVEEAHRRWLQIHSAPELDVAEREAKEAQLARREQLRTVDELEDDLERHQAALRAIQKGNVPTPTAAEEIVDACQSQGLNVDVLASRLGAQSATMEAALQGFLWSIVCDPDDVSNVIQVSKRLGSTLPILNRDNAYWQDWQEDDGVVTTPFGAVAAPQPEPRILIERSPKHQKTLSKRSASLKVGLDEARHILEEVEAKWDAARKALELARTKEELPDTPPDRNGAKRRLVDFSNAFDEAKQRLEEIKKNTPNRLSPEIEERHKHLEPKTKRLDALQEQREEAALTVEKTPAEIAEKDRDLVRVEKWDPDARAAVYDFESPPRQKHLIKRDIDAARRYLDSRTSPDSECRELYTRLEDRLKRVEDKVASIRKTHDENLETLKEAKQQYGQTANDAMREFKKRFEEVSKSFQVNAKVEYTRIKPDMDEDAIQDASLEITIQFGDKPATTLRGGLSGGEGAVAGILLRLCMMGSDVANFFIVDEPYQNLDARNVRRIAEFLEHSRHQIVMVVPTSDDPNQYRGALRAYRMHPFDENGKSPAPDRIGIKASEVVDVAA